MSVIWHVRCSSFHFIFHSSIHFFVFLHWVTVLFVVSYIWLDFIRCITLNICSRNFVKIYLFFPFYTGISNFLSLRLVFLCLRIFFCLPRSLGLLYRICSRRTCPTISKLLFYLGPLLRSRSVFSWHLSPFSSHLTNLWDPNLLWIVL